MNCFGNNVQEIQALKKDACALFIFSGAMNNSRHESESGKPLVRVRVKEHQRFITM